MVVCRIRLTSRNISVFCPANFFRCQHGRPPTVWNLVGARVATIVYDVLLESNVYRTLLSNDFFPFRIDEF